MSDYKFEIGELVRVKESRGFPIYENEVGEVIDREIFKKLTECIKYRVKFDNDKKKAFVENDLEGAQVNEENGEDVFEYEVGDRVRVDFRYNSYWNGKQGEIVDRFKNGKHPAYTVSFDSGGDKDFFEGELEFVPSLEEGDKVLVVDPRYEGVVAEVRRQTNDGLYELRSRNRVVDGVGFEREGLEFVEKKGEKDMNNKEKKFVNGEEVVVSESAPKAWAGESAVITRNERVSPKRINYTLKKKIDGEVQNLKIRQTNFEKMKAAKGDTVEVDLLHEFDYEIPEHAQPLSVDTLKRLKNIFFNGVTIVEVVHLGEEKEGEEDWHEHGERIINEVLDIVEANDDYFTVLSGILGEVTQKKLEKIEEIIPDDKSVEDYFVFLNCKILGGEDHE